MRPRVSARCAVPRPSPCTPLEKPPREPLHVAGRGRRVRERRLRERYCVVEARVGLEALALIEQRTGTIDLVLTDIVMPALNGSELASKVRRLYPALRECTSADGIHCTFDALALLRNRRGDEPSHRERADHAERQAGPASVSPLEALRGTAT